MNQPEQDVGAAGAERQHADQDRHDQQHHLPGAKPEHQRFVEDEGRDRDGRDGQPDGRQRRPQRQVDALLQVVLARRSNRRDAFRQQDQQRHQNAGEGGRRTDHRGTGVDHDREFLCQQHHGQQRHQQQRQADQQRPVRRVRAGPALIDLADDEVVAMPDGLGVEEHAVEDDGDDADERQLGPGIERPGRGECVVRHDQGDGRQHDQDAEIEVDPGDLEFLLAEPQAASQDAEPDQAVAHDHHHREHGVARQRRIGALAQHQGGDQGDFDDGHRQCQQQRAVRFADPLGDDFGVMHGGENGSEQDHQQHDRENQAAGPRLVGQSENDGRCEEQHGQRWKHPRRSWHRTVYAHDGCSPSSPCGIYAGKISRPFRSCRLPGTEAD